MSGEQLLGWWLILHGAFAQYAGEGHAGAVRVFILCSLEIAVGIFILRNGL